MSRLTDTIRGRAWTFGDSIDTNQLAGGGLHGSDREDTLRINCLRGVRPEFTEHVKSGDILVAGNNFGCGSSRESAVEALQLCGVSVVLAESVARIQRRNSVALALPTFTVPQITALVEDGDEIEVSYPERVVRNLTQGTQLGLPDFSPGVEEIYAAGGISEVMRIKLASMGFSPPNGAPR